MFVGRSCEGEEAVSSRITAVLRSKPGGDLKSDASRIHAAFGLCNEGQGLEAHEAFFKGFFNCIITAALRSK